MHKFIIGLLSEDSKISSIRLMSILCVVSAILIACYGMYHNRDLIGISTVVTSFLGPAFAAKVVSKKLEK